MDAFRARLLPLLPALALGLVPLGCGGKQQAPPQMPPPQVTVVTLKAQQVTLTRDLPGRTSPHLVAEVRPQVSGIVKSRLFEEGSLVRAGQPLYQLDDSTYRADYANAHAAVAKADAARANARLTAKRASDLHAAGIASQADVDNTTAALRSAEADVAAAQAAADRARVSLGYCRITAPIGGRVGKSSVTPGALVTANQGEPLATIQQLDPIYVDVSQSSSEWLRLRREVEAGKVAAGASALPVEVVLEDGSRYQHAGRLQFTDVTVDETTGSFALRVLVPNPENTLRPGMYVHAVLPEAGARQAVLAPQQGVTRDPKGNATAMVVGADNKVQQREVVVSRTVGDQWLVDSGLAAGDRVIVEGLQKVQPGMAVVAVEAAPQPAAATPAAAGAAAPSR